MSDQRAVGFADLSRAIRAALGLAQEDLAAHLEVSRKTVQRWERGTAAPDARVEELLAELCRDRQLFLRARPQLSALGVTSWEDLSAVLTRSRRGRSPRRPTVVGSVTLLGRVADLAALRTMLEADRLVTITGPGGVGKTSLARAVAQRWPGTVVDVEFAAVRSADLLLDAIAARLGRPVDPHGSLRDHVISGLTAPTLLVADNLEHLPAAFPVIADLVATCRDLRVLATSRSPLRLRDEVVHRLGPLSVDGATSDAARLFSSLAARAGAPLAASDPRVAAQIVAICRRLDGLPLSIELAAARLRAMSLDDLHARLDRPLRLLADGAVDAPDRHRSMRASLDWSVELLTDTSRKLLCELAAFVGGWTLAAAEFVGEPSGLEDLTELVDAGLVQRRQGRYQMTEPVREYADALQPGDRGRFIGWACHEAGRIDAGLRGPDADELLTDFDAELANFRAALATCLDTGDGPRAHQLCLALTGGWDARSMLREARRWIELTLATEARAFSAAALRNWLAYFATLQGDFDAAQRHADAALGVWEEHAVDSGIGYACLILGRVAAETGRLEDAQQLLTRSEAALHAAGDQWGLVRPVNALGELARELGDLPGAQARHLRAADMCRALGDDGSLPSILADLANVAADERDGARAIAYAEQALAIASRRGNSVGVASGLDALGRGYLWAGDPARAIATWAEADAVRADIHHPTERRDRIALDLDRAEARRLAVGAP